ncbi:MAG: hypothetical protein ACHQPI_04255 [Thermoanaerobaculia bacterium]
MLLALLLAVPAGDSSGSWARWHFVFGSGMEMSVLFRRDAGGDETRLLVSRGGDRFVFDSRQDPSGNDSTEAVKWLSTGEILERRILLKGWDGVAGCEGVSRPDACLLWKGASGRVTSRLSQFSGEGAPAARREVAALVSPAFAERLFSLSAVLSTMAEFGSYTSDFLVLVWPERFGAKPKFERGTRTRGCDFDALFGHPCSDEERAREEARLGPDGLRSPGASPPMRTPPHPPRG